MRDLTQQDKLKITTMVVLIGSGALVLLAVANDFPAWRVAVIAASFGAVAAFSWASRCLQRLEDLYGKAKELAYDSGYLRGQLSANHDFQWAAETLAALRDEYPLANSGELVEMLQQKIKARDIFGD